MLLANIDIKAQFKISPSLENKALVTYVKGANGMYDKHTDVPLKSLGKIDEMYAYDKKNKSLYVVTTNSNVMIMLDKETAKAVKESKAVKQMTGGELEKSVDEYSSMLDKKYFALNEQRQQFLKDSIQKAREDSILKVKKEEENRALKEKLKTEYINTHKHFIMPFETGAYCPMCDKTVKRNSVFCMGIQNDTVYYFTKESGDLGLSYMKGHVSELSDVIRDGKSSYHYNAFKDSLAQKGHNLQEEFPEFNMIQYWEYLDKLKQVAPYGYINDWSWDDEYSFLKFNVSYTNTNSKTIKYVSVYFKLENDVGDVRLIGSFRGTGPVRQLETAEWKWDDSHYIVSGDATNMVITKLVLTYMNGKQQVVSGKYLKINPSYKDTEDRSAVISVPELPETFASFPGGNAALMKFLNANVHYPVNAQENGVQGRVIVSFIVKRDGSLTDVRIARSVDPNLDREAMRVVKSMPRWIPAKENGVNVESEFNVPVSFRLQ